MSISVIDKRLDIFAPITKLAIVGSRSFLNYDLLRNAIDAIRITYPNINLIISGGATGADKLGERYAQQNRISTKIYLPNWKDNGKAAGVIRNKDIICNADVVVAFWDGKSKGTSDSINKAQNYNKLLYIVNF